MRKFLRDHLGVMFGKYSRDFRKFEVSLLEGILLYMLKLYHYGKHRAFCYNKLISN